MDATKNPHKGGRQSDCTYHSITTAAQKRRNITLYLIASRDRARLVRRLRVRMPDIWGWA